MRTPNPLLRERLRQALRAAPRRGSSELAALLKVTPQTVRRLLDELPGPQLLFAGRTRRARYALRRPLRGMLTDIPVYGIDETGRASALASLALTEPEGTLLPLEGTAWPVPDQSKDGWWDGLPYPVYAARPQGYMGRQFARAEHRALMVPENPDEWSDDDIVWVLSQRGTDVSGNLLLGDAAYDAWFRSKAQAIPIHPERNQPEAYAHLAAQAVAEGGGGSTAAGEFPKFTTVRELVGSATPHVLVKFSGAGGSAAEQRWGDLLVCEHLALECARQLDGITPARSRTLSHGGRVFVEVERFDRLGLHGRRALCGLEAIHPAFLGDRETAWPPLARRLEAMNLLDAASTHAIEALWWYGRLIANTDMHLGNLSFYVDHVLRLAPAYDMLPMAYAPLAGGEVPPRTFTPEHPLPPQRDTWLAACDAALAFWDTAAADGRISEAFRAVCAANARALRAVAEQV
jgi:hypothetical protein